MKRGKGRPRNSDNVTVARADLLMGVAVHQLMFWGYTRARACKTVAKVAKELLDRRGPEGDELEASRVRELYDEAGKLPTIKGHSRRFLSKSWLTATKPTRLQDRAGNCYPCRDIESLARGCLLGHIDPDDRQSRRFGRIVGDKVIRDEEPWYLEPQYTASGRKRIRG